MTLLTTRVEVVTDSGCRATLDPEGWHSADPRLLDRLNREAPVDINGADPLYDAAQVAKSAVGIRVILMRRRGMIGELVGRTSQLFRALTDSSLQRAIGGSLDDVEGSTAQVRQLKRLRLLRLALLCTALGVALLAYGYLAK